MNPNKFKRSRDRDRHSNSKNFASSVFVSLFDLPECEARDRLSIFSLRARERGWQLRMRAHDSRLRWFSFNANK